MYLNPLNELKRRLEDGNTPLPKRLCLAKNVIQSHHFPSAPKERVVSEWLEELMKTNQLSDDTLRDVISWVNVAEEMTGELKSQLIQIIAQYIKQKPLKDEYMQYILLFLNNSQISTQLMLHVDNYLLITVTLLQNMKSVNNVKVIDNLLKSLINYYKESKKKLEFVTKLLDGENLETIFSYLNTECHDTVIDVCQNIIFPMSKKSLFASFLQNLIRKDNIDEFISVKGDSIQAVLKTMSAYFTFPKGRTNNNQKFLTDFTNVFVSCFFSESQLIFAYFIMITNTLNMNQSYLTPATKIPAIVFDNNNDRIKRNLLLNMLEILLEKEVDVSVRLTDTMGQKVSKIEIKKNFSSFLQAVIMEQLKLEGKLDITTLNIIKVALKLDPNLIEQKICQILPPIMAAKKHNANIMESYTEMLNCLIEILFKLSRGTTFINQILPHIKICLEACNTEQFELKQKIVEFTENGRNCEKLKSKLITGNDIFPQKCVEIFGTSTSELMFRQNKEVLLTLQTDFEEQCLIMLEEELISPSNKTLAEVLSTILSTYLYHNKMADHIVPIMVAEEFWDTYQTFEEECLKKFCKCILKLSYDDSLTLSFLKLCLSCAQLKLLNIQYGNVKPVLLQERCTSQVLDLNLILPCLESEQWTALLSRIVEGDAVLVLTKLLLLKCMAIGVSTNKCSDQEENLHSTKSYLIKQLPTTLEVISTHNHFAAVLFGNLQRGQIKMLSKSLVKLFIKGSNMELLQNYYIRNNRQLLNSMVNETARNICKCFENSEDLYKGLSVADFNIISFIEKVDIKEYFNSMFLKEQQDDTLQNCIEILKNLPVAYLEESYALTTLFVLLITKKCCQAKKLRRNIDYVLQSLFVLSPKSLDIYKIFSVAFIFSFEENGLIDLLNLKIKTSNYLVIIKSILELAVKKVKTDNKIVKSLVKLLLRKQANKKSIVSSTEYFSDPVFQISCLILPIIAKEKRAITTSAYRSILADLQDKLHTSMLECFKNVDFTGNVTLLRDSVGNIEDGTVDSESKLATLNAMGAYSLTLSKYCETTDIEEIKKLDCLWSGLEFFLKNAIQTIQNPTSKPQHTDSSLQLLNVTLRYIKKLDSHPIFCDKDQTFLQIWKGIVARLLIVFEGNNLTKGTDRCLEDMSITLKFVCELVSLDCFVKNFVMDLDNLAELKFNAEETPSTLTKYKVSKYLWTQCLKANIVGPKCVALTKIAYKSCKDSRLWIQQQYDINQEAKIKKQTKSDLLDDQQNKQVTIVVDDEICAVLKVDLDTLSEIILAGKKITLDYKFIDAIFEHQHLVHHILGYGVQVLCVVTMTAFRQLFEGCVAVLNNLLVTREELIGDRWPCYMQCYRALATLLCARASVDTLDGVEGEGLRLLAHSIEKLTQSICKRREHASRSAAYSVGSLCSLAERAEPIHRALCTLLQVCDTSYTAAFLRRALADRPGHVTVTNLISTYKRYHKYVGNA